MFHLFKRTASKIKVAAKGKVRLFVDTDKQLTMLDENNNKTIFATQAFVESAITTAIQSLNSPAEPELPQTFSVLTNAIFADGTLSYAGGTISIEGSNIPSFYASHPLALNKSLQFLIDATQYQSLLISADRNNNLVYGSADWSASVSHDQGQTLDLWDGRSVDSSVVISADQQYTVLLNRIALDRIEVNVLDSNGNSLLNKDVLVLYPDSDARVWIHARLASEQSVFSIPVIYQFLGQA